MPITTLSVGFKITRSMPKMGMSANQARFLSLTSRQVDLEYRM